LILVKARRDLRMIEGFDSVYEMNDGRLARQERK